jgi:hypothetical protein
MEQYSEEDVKLKRYLMGESSTEEQVLIEEQLFLDGDYLLRLQAIEDELIDDYVYDELPATERKRVETHLLSRHGGHTELSFAKALKRYAETQAEVIVTTPEPVPHQSTRPSHNAGLRWFLPTLLRRNRRAGFLLVATALVILAVVVWLAVSFTRSRQGQIELMQAQSPATQQPQPTLPPVPTRDSGKIVAEKDTGDGAVRPGETPTPATPRAGVDKEDVAERRKHSQGASPSIERQPALSLAFLLLPGGAVRGEERTKTISLPPDVSTVLLQLALVEDDYRSYTAMLQAGEQTIRTWTGLKAKDSTSGRVVSVSVPAGVLRQRNYQVRLSGLAPDGQAQEILTYFFQVSDR